jgi:hypothetical protein
VDSLDTVQMMGPPKASNPSLFVANYLYNHHCSYKVL